MRRLRWARATVAQAVEAALAAPSQLPCSAFAAPLQRLCKAFAAPFSLQRLRSAFAKPLQHLLFAAPLKRLCSAFAAPLQRLRSSLTPRHPRLGAALALPVYARLHTQAPHTQAALRTTDRRRASPHRSASSRHAQRSSTLRCASTAARAENLPWLHGRVSPRPVLPRWASHFLARLREPPSGLTTSAPWQAGPAIAARAQRKREARPHRATVQRQRRGRQLLPGGPRGVRCGLAGSAARALAGTLPLPD